MAFRKYNGFKKFLDFLTGFAAFLTVLLIIFMYVTNHFGFFSGYKIMSYLPMIRNYMVAGIFFLVGLEFFTTKNWFLLIVYILLAGVAGIALFQPAWLDAFFNLFHK